MSHNNSNNKGSFLLVISILIFLLTVLILCFFLNFVHPPIKKQQKREKEKNNQKGRKSALPAENQVFHMFFGPYGPRGNSRIFLGGFLGSDGKSNERHRKKQAKNYNKKRQQ